MSELYKLINDKVYFLMSEFIALETAFGQTTELCDCCITEKLTDKIHSRKIKKIYNNLKFVYSNMVDLREKCEKKCILKSRLSTSGFFAEDTTADNYSLL